VPDLRPTIEKATDEELAEIFKASDVRITYDKNRQALDFAATITSELMTDENDRPQGRSRVSDIAGERSALRGDLRHRRRARVPWLALT
ncbi:MAG TPA: hypothetical protein VGL68_06950, partial [Solirubrobacteraceae bacterium]